VFDVTKQYKEDPAKFQNRKSIYEAESDDEA